MLYYTALFATHWQRINFGPVLNPRSSRTKSTIPPVNCDRGIACGPSGATIWHGGVSQEYDQTPTGLDPGDTAKCFEHRCLWNLWSSGKSGLPIAVYQVDDTPAATVTAPITQATLYRQNFWTSDPQLPSLVPGAFHKLVVTTTAPNNTLWIDYLAYPPTNSTATTSTSSTSTFSSTFSTSATPTTSSTITPTNTAGGQPAFGTSDTRTNVGAIVAGIVVGTVAFILATPALVYIRRRRSRPIAREYLMRGEIDASPNMFHNHHTPTV